MALVRRTALLLMVAAFATAATASASGAHPPKPASRDAALADGCQRSDFGIGFDTSPEWVYVYRNPAIRMAQGVVRVVHGSLEDSILQHRSYDFNANLVPDRAFSYLVAGNPSQKTNNYAPDEGEAGDGCTSSGRARRFRSSRGRTTAIASHSWGSWIWDCGHWESTENNTGGTVTGEHSELHPLNGIVVNRRAPYLSARGESETDVLDLKRGRRARAVEQCALTSPVLTVYVFGSPFPSRPTK